MRISDWSSDVCSSDLFNKTRLRPDAQTILDWATNILKKYPDMKVEVAGHTDSVGSDSYNQKLSEGRAQSVIKYFVDHRVRSEERRLGKECVRTFRSRCYPFH